MAHKIIYLCSECKSEWLEDSSKEQPRECSFCGSSKIYRSHNHQRFAKKSRDKVRWSYRI